MKSTVIELWLAIGMVLVVGVIVYLNSQFGFTDLFIEYFSKSRPSY